MYNVFCETPCHNIINYRLGVYIVEKNVPRSKLQERVGFPTITKPCTIFLEITLRRVNLTLRLLIELPEDLKRDEDGPRRNNSYRT